MDSFLNTVIPIITALFGGVIGSLVTIFWTEIRNQKNLPKRVMWRYICIGAISGFVAVNLLNPNGPYTEKIPLAILAGLSPISFLRSQSVSNNNQESEELSKYADSFENPIEVPNTDDGDEFVKSIKKRYTIGRGDGKND